MSVALRKGSQNGHMPSDQPDHEAEAERALIGAAMRGATLAELRPAVRPTDFYDERLGTAWAEALKLDARGTAVDNVTLSAALEKLPALVGEGSMLTQLGGRAALAMMVNDCPAVVNARHYAEVVAQAAARRDGRAHSPRSISVEVERVGLGYRSVLPLGVELHLDRIRGSRELTGHLVIRWTRPLIPGDGHIYAGNFNVSRPWERTNLAKECSRVGSMGLDTWREIFEGFCTGVLAAHHEPARVLDLTKVGARPSAKTLWGPMCPIDQITTLMAKEGEGKSTATRLVAVCVAANVEALGWRPTISGPVLILDAEADEYETSEGVNAISAGLGIKPPQIHYMPCAMGGALHDQIDAVSKRVAEIKPVLIVADSAELLAGVGQDNESFEARTQRLYAALKLLPGTKLVVDHLAASERDTGGPASKAYGSVFKMAWSRQVWELKREKAPTEDRAELLLINTKYNAGAKAKAIGLAYNYSPGRITVERTDILAPELQGSLPVPERMSRLLRNGSLTVEAIAESLDKSPAYVRQLVSRYKERFVRLPDQRIGLASHV